MLFIFERQIIILILGDLSVTKIIKCNCDGYLGNSSGSTYQDNTYGKNMRAHNVIAKEPKNSNFRCTICQTEHSKGSETSENSNKNKTKDKGKSK